MIPWLPPGSDFPPLEEALDDPNGLLAAGNDLAPDTLISAYTRGIFPWYDPSQPVLWWTPNPRCVFRPGDFHISRRLGRHLRNADLTFYLDRDFERVIDVCAAPRDDDGGTWITPEMRAAYLRLHALGHAHCVTVFEDGELAGGLYGVQLGGVLFGESMFSTRTNGSKSVLALLWRLAPRLGIRITPRGGAVIYGRSDTTINRHGIRMGTSEIYRVVEELPEVLDSLVVDLEYLGRESFMPLFVVLREGVSLDEDLKGRIKAGIRDNLSARHVPNDIVAVPDVPRTLTGKKMELPIKKLLLGQSLEKVANPDAMANPESIRTYQDYAEQRGTAG